MRILLKGSTKRLSLDLPSLNLTFLEFHALHAGVAFDPFGFFFFLAGSDFLLQLLHILMK